MSVNLCGLAFLPREMLACEVLRVEIAPLFKNSTVNKVLEHFTCIESHRAVLAQSMPPDTGLMAGGG